MGPTAARHPPGSAAPQDQGDGVAGEDARQAGEVAVPVGVLLKHLLVHLPLWVGRTTGDDDNSASPKSPKVGRTHANIPVWWGCGGRRRAGDT